MAKTMAATAPPLSYYRFTNEWFTPHVEAWTKLLDHVRPTQILEVGCYEGRATTFLIERCTRYGAPDLTCVDTWQGAADLPPKVMEGVEERFDSNVRLATDWSGRATVEKIKKPSALALPELIAAGTQFDFIYIDGSHVAADVLTDAIDGFRLLRVGGAMVLDDYVWCMETHGKEDLANMPKPAIDAFVNLFIRKIQLVNCHSQLSLLKTAD
jgi:predicted O-methyltransferase YrrM